MHRNIQYKKWDFVGGKAVIALAGCAMAILGVTSVTWVTAYGKEYTSLALANYSAASGIYSYGILAASILGIIASAIAVFNPSSLYRKIILISGGLTILGWLGAVYHLSNTQQLWVSQYTYVVGSKALSSVGFYLPLLGGMFSLLAAASFEPHYKDETKDSDMSFIKYT